MGKLDHSFSGKPRRATSSRASSCALLAGLNFLKDEAITGASSRWQRACRPSFSPGADAGVAAAALGKADIEKARRVSEESWKPPCEVVAAERDALRRLTNSASHGAPSLVPGVKCLEGALGVKTLLRVDAESPSNPPDWTETAEDVSCAQTRIDDGVH